MTSKKIHDIATGEIVEIPFNDKDFEELEILRIASEAEKQAKAEADQARQALLDRLGISEEEARLLLS